MMANCCIDSGWTVDEAPNMPEEREARKPKSVRPNHEPDTEPVAPQLFRVNAPDALESEAPHMMPASPVMFGQNSQSKALGFEDFRLRAQHSIQDAARAGRGSDVPKISGMKPAL